MFRKTSIVLTSLTIMVALLMLWVTSATRSSSYAKAKETQKPFATPTPPFKANDSTLAASPCANALAQNTVCDSANNRALEIMSANQLKAVVVVQDVQTGAVVAFAASQPSELDVTTPVSPLSLSKVLLSASWWDNRQPDASFDSTSGTPNAQNPAYRSRVTVHEMLVGGSDSAGRQMAVALRKSVGTKTVVADFKRYGFSQRTNSPRDDKFWGELAPTWETRLIPAPAYVSLSDKTNDADWAESLSIGETNIKVTALHVSRFLQAIGNDGVLLPPVAREEKFTSSVTKPPVSRHQIKNAVRIIQESTALRLQSAMRDTVQRGTATSIR